MSEGKDVRDEINKIVKEIKKPSDDIQTNEVKSNDKTIKHNVKKRIDCCLISLYKLAVHDCRYYQ